MPRGIKSLLPIGSNMNDLAYPFRGEHKVPPEMNHGHTSSAAPFKPTTLAMRISGTNLMIEQLEVPKGQELKCDLGVDGGPTRSVRISSSSGRHPQLGVPGDGRDYHLTATVVGDAKHYCRLTLNGSEGAGFLRVRAPSDPHQKKVLQLTADGKVLTAPDGWYAVPLHTSDCSISVSDHAGSLPARMGGEGPGTKPVWMNQENGALNSFFSTTTTPLVVEAVHNLPEHCTTPVMECLQTGAMIPLAEHTSVTIPVQNGPYRLRLPSVTTDRSNGSMLSQAAPPLAPAVTTPATTLPALPTVAAVLPPTPIEQPSVVPAVAPPPTPPAPLVPDVIPDVEFGVSTEGSTTTAVLRADGFNVHLVSETGNSVSGQNEAKLSLSHKGSQMVRGILYNAAGKEVLRQRFRIPSIETPVPVSVQVTEKENGVSVSARKGSTVLLDGSPVVNPEDGVQVVIGATPKQITVEQPNTNGSVSSVQLNVVPRTASTPPQPSPVASTPPTPEVALWAQKVAEALRNPVEAESQRIIQSISAPSLETNVIQQFIGSRLNQPVPELSLVAQQKGIDEVQCMGYHITSQVNTDQPYGVAHNGFVPLPSGSSVKLNAVNPSSGNVAASCRLRLAVPTHSEDEGLLSRLLDSLQRNQLFPAPVAADLTAINPASLSPLGQRVLPLLIKCLEKILQGQSREDVLFTARNGFLENIYTRDPSLALTASINGGHAHPLEHHGRVPSSAAFPVNEPTFVKLTATDKTTGSVKGETVLTVMGPAPEAPPIQPPPAIATARVEAASVPAAPPLEKPAEPLRLLSLPPKPTPVAAAQEAAPAPAAALSVPVAAPTDHIPASSGAIPFLDISMQCVADSTHVRLVSPAESTIACRVDGIGGGSGRNDLVLKVVSSQPHTLEVSVLNQYGVVMFQQKLEIPPVSSLVWGVCLQDSGLSVDPDGLATTTTISLDRAPERSLQSNFFPFDAFKPHFICLRRYLNGLHGMCSGELTLRLPGFINPNDLMSLLHLLKMREEGHLDDFNLERQMAMLSTQCASPLLKDVIATLLPLLLKCITNREGDGGPRVFFRLTGAE